MFSTELSPRSFSTELSPRSFANAEFRHCVVDRNLPVDAFFPATESPAVLPAPDFDRWRSHSCALCTFQKCAT